MVLDGLDSNVFAASQLPKIVSEPTKKLVNSSVIHIIQQQQWPQLQDSHLSAKCSITAVCVQNFCATVDACGLQEYMCNVKLLHR